MKRYWYNYSAIAALTLAVHIHVEEASQKLFLPTFCKFSKMSLKLYNFLHSKVTSLVFTDIVAIACLYIA